jgi:hypothetical protein
MSEKVQLLVKVPEELKVLFKQACLENDTSVSREVRRFMKAYVEMQSTMPDKKFDA